MTRRKGEITGHMNERDFPHLVELALPPGGFRSQTSEFEAFHREPRIPTRRGRGRHEGGQFYIRFCFPDAATADASTITSGRALDLPRRESPELTPQRGRSASARAGLSPTTSWCRRISSSCLRRRVSPEVSDDLREVIEQEWSELVHKLPPKD